MDADAAAGAPADGRADEIALAVLTGDLVGSTRGAAEAVNASFALLQEIFTTAAAQGWVATPPRLTRFRGDGWQAVVTPGTRALRLALVIRARLRPEAGALWCRVALGFGDMAHAGTTDLSDADGTAFHRAGRALDKMARRRRLAVAEDGAPAGLVPALAVCDALAARWTAAQAEAVALALDPAGPTQEAIGAQLGLTQQAVQDRLDLAGFWAVEELLQAVGDA